MFGVNLEGAGTNTQVTFKSPALLGLIWVSNQKVFVASPRCNLVMWPDGFDLQFANGSFTGQNHDYKIVDWFQSWYHTCLS